MATTIHGFNGQYRFLSNFWPASINYEGIEYCTTESAYQASKTLDSTIRKHIAGLSPGQAKRYAKTILLRQDWEFVKVGIMEQLLRLKFAIPELRQQLRMTGDAHLEETNHWGDRFWGVSSGVGENVLGQLLMKIREEI